MYKFKKSIVLNFLKEIIWSSINLLKLLLGKSWEITKVLNMPFPEIQL